MKYSLLSLLCLGVLAVSGQETAPTVPGTKGKAGYTTEEGLGGPSAVPHQLVENDLKKTSKFRFPAIDETLKIGSTGRKNSTMTMVFNWGWTTPLSFNL